MKNIIPFLLFITSLFIISCSDEEKVNGDNNDEQINSVALTLERERVSLIPGETVSIKITNGNDKYNVKSSNENIVKAIVTGDLKVTDNKGKVAILKISIKNATALTLNKKSVLINAVQGTEILKVENGNGGYSVMFDHPSIAKVGYATEGGIIAIKGKKNGRTNGCILHFWCRLLGAVSEVRVWKTARSEQQIKENM